MPVRRRRRLGAVAVAEARIVHPGVSSLKVERRERVFYCLERPQDATVLHVREFRETLAQGDDAFPILY